jgi:hypothetical protein
MNTKPLGTMLVSLLAIAAMTTSCTATIETSIGQPSSNATVPSGWKTYTYRKLALAVPATWVVRHETACQTGGEDGLLLLGRSTSLPSCSSSQAPTNVVAVTQLRGKITKFIVGVKPVPLNGVSVYYEPILPGAGQVAGGEWFIPSLGVQVVITGPDTDQVGRMLRRS